jgi:hypothetical protein
MPNITLSISDELLKKARELAQKNSMSLNALVRALLKERVSAGDADWLDDVFARADKSGAGSKGKKWEREDLYG